MTFKQYRERFLKPGERERKELGRFFHFQRELSFYLTIPFVFLPFTPNQITILANIVQLIGIYLIASGRGSIQFGGLVLYYFGNLLDFVDGNIARYRKQTSTVGIFLDQVGHVCVAPCFFSAIGYAAFVESNESILLAILPVLAAFPVLISYQLVALHQFIDSTSVQNERKSIQASEPVFKKLLRKCISGPFHFKAELLLAALIFDRLALLAVFYCCYLPVRFLLQLSIDYRHIKRLDG